MFKVPDSDDLPSTPPRDQLLFSNHPKSTTPSHEPPTYLTNVSTTPLGPPPRSVYGSSFNGANDTFLRSRGTPLKGFALPQSSPPQEEDEDAEGEEDEVTAPSFAPRVALSSMLNSPRGFKRSRSGKVQPRHDSDMPIIARDLAKQSGSAHLDEPDDFVLRSEDIVATLDGKARNQPIAELDAALSNSSAQLTSLWSQLAPPSTDEGSIGPAEEDPIAQASYVASFLLQVHHPHTAKPVQPVASARFPRVGLGQRAPTSAIPFPKALLNWLNAHHNPYPDDYDAILMTQPAPSSSESFWDIAYSLALRGKFARLIRLLKDARFEHAVTALDDGAARPGYHGRQLESTEALIAHCISVLELCPALEHENWDVKGNDWAIFRQSVRQAINELEEFAEEDDDDEDQDIPSNAFARSARSERQRSLNFSTASKRAESKIPWTIYESLRSLYGQMLGSTDEIVLVSQDWLEACVYLTVWWNGEDDMEPAASVSRGGLRRSTSTKQRTRAVDIAPLAAYRNKLYDAYAQVTSNPEDSVFQVDTMDPTLVALASVMEDNVEGVVALLKTWSLPVAASVVEIGALGAWLPQGRPRSRGLVEQGFSSEDLMVLSHGPSSQKPVSDIERDGILLQYADALSEREAFQGASGAAKEGWELAVSVLGRLDDGVAAQRKIGDMLEAIELKDDVRVDKVLALCSDLGLSEQARAISERYADSLTDSPQAYGAALIFYARAHIASKLKDTLALLTSLSLVQSAAVPSTSQMDQQLASLLTKDRPGFVRLARSDPKAATLLSSNFSGYATLRKFYDLRDQDVSQSPSSNTSHLRPLERKREAAKALMAVIESAADCIRGGLFDPEVESAIPADALLVLLGETLPLLSTEQRIFSKNDVYTLLRIVEDFSTAPARIRDRAEDLFRASGSSYRGGGGTDSLKKSKSDLSTGSGSSYDMLASSVMALSQEHGKVQTARGWDWRKGLDGAGGASVGSKEVLAVLRLALSQEVARGMTGIY